MEGAGYGITSIIFIPLSFFSQRLTAESSLRPLTFCSNQFLCFAQDYVLRYLGFCLFVFSMYNLIIGCVGLNPHAALNEWCEDFFLFIWVVVCVGNSPIFFVGTVSSGRLEITGVRGVRARRLCLSSDWLESATVPCYML